VHSDGRGNDSALPVITNGKYIRSTTDALNVLVVLPDLESFLEPIWND